MRLRAAYASDEPESARLVRDHRDRVSDRPHRARATLLGFDAPTGNTYGSIATVDYLLESVSAAAVLLAGLGRVRPGSAALVHERIRLSAAADGFVQGSSIMPQKRNPVALEHARAIASKALGQATGDRAEPSTTPRSATSSTPRTICSRSSRRCSRTRTGRCGWSPRRWRGAVQPRQARRARRAGVDHGDRARRHAGARPWRAVQDEPQRGGEVRRRMRSSVPSESRSVVLREVSTAVIGRAIEYDEPALAELLSARHFVAVRTTPGGPAPSETAPRDRRVASSACLGRRVVRAGAGRLVMADESLRIVASTI